MYELYTEYNATLQMPTPKFSELCEESDPAYQAGDKEQEGVPNQSLIVSNPSANHISPKNFKFIFLKLFVFRDLFFIHFFKFGPDPQIKEKLPQCQWITEQPWPKWTTIRPPSSPEINSIGTENGSRMGLQQHSYVKKTRAHLLINNLLQLQ